MNTTAPEKNFSAGRNAGRLPVGPVVRPAESLMDRILIIGRILFIYSFMTVETGIDSVITYDHTTS